MHKSCIKLAKDRVENSDLANRAINFRVHERQGI